MSDMNSLMRYGLGEHKKGKEITYDEGRLSKSVAVKYDYYDKTRKVILKDRDGNVVNIVWW